MKRLPFPYKKDDPTYRQIWRVVDGALRDAFSEHPDYIEHVNPRRRDHIRASVVKRVTGQVHGYMAEKGRSTSRVAVESEAAAAYDGGFLTRLAQGARKLAGVCFAPVSTYSRRRAA